MKRIRRVCFGIFSLALGHFSAQVEVKASTIGTPDQSYIAYETLNSALSFLQDFTNTQFSYSKTFNIGDFKMVVARPSSGKVATSPRRSCGYMRKLLQGQRNYLHSPDPAKDFGLRDQIRRAFRSYRTLPRFPTS